tara:strand:- start:287 stop:508 length:222 start_codon:yes stop_codon:yes gene_type:complete
MGVPVKLLQHYTQPLELIGSKCLACPIVSIQKWADGIYKEALKEWIFQIRLAQLSLRLSRLLNQSLSDVRLFD